jgi:hypothetical protein
MQSLTDRPRRSTSALLSLTGLLALSTLALACSSGADPAPQPPTEVSDDDGAPEAPPEEPGEEPQESCSELAETPCRKSPDCTLVQDESQGSGYLCRAAQGPCEQGFRQEGNSREECEEREGCRFEPGDCYCPPEVTCVCGGGPPPRCVEAAASSTAPTS